MTRKELIDWIKSENMEFGYYFIDSDFRVPNSIFKSLTPDDFYINMQDNIVDIIQEG